MSAGGVLGAHPPAPLELHPSVDHVEVIVPDGRRRDRRLGTRVGWLLVVMTAWGFGVAGVFALALLEWSAWEVALAMLAVNVLCGVAAVGLVGGLVAVGADGWVRLRLRPASLDVGQLRIAWELVMGVSCEEGHVDLLLRTGERLTVARDLPDECAGWLARTLVDHQWRAISGRLDSEALAAVASLKERTG